jgi:pimeloyl-ACP methyl ester carboxylesterase
MTTSAVLVHGAWHGAWCFDPVLDALAARGVEAVAVDLPGHGDDVGPLGDLHTDAARVREVLDGLDDDCVLLGHSYGGAVITEAGSHPKVRHLVYLCAYLLDEGESCMSVSIREAEALGLRWDEEPNLVTGIQVQDDGTSTVARDVAAECFFHDCEPAAAEAALERLGRQPMQTLADEPRSVAWRERPSTYVVCTDDRAIPEPLQRVMAKRTTNVVEWPTSHSPFLCAPDRVAELLSGLVTGP